MLNSERSKLQRQGQAIKELVISLLNDWLKEHSVSELAQELGQSESWCYQAMNPLSTTRFAVEHTPIINALVGGKLMYRIGELCEHLMIPMRLVEETEKDARALGRIAKEFGEFMMLSGQAEMDGKIGGKEPEQIWNEASDVAVFVMAYAKACKLRAAKRRIA